MRFTSNRNIYYIYLFDKSRPSTVLRQYFPWIMSLFGFVIEHFEIVLPFRLWHAYVACGHSMIMCKAALRYSALCWTL